MTLNRLAKFGRSKRKKYCRTKNLGGNPQKMAICRKVFTMKPKKPNSSNRKVAKVEILSMHRSVVVGIPGIGHTLQRFSKILIRGGNPCDLPGVHYKAVRGTRDFNMNENIRRGKRRSKFGVPANKVKYARK